MKRFDIKAIEEDGRTDWEMYESKNGYFVEYTAADKIINRYQKDIRMLLNYFDLTNIISIQTQKEMKL